MRVFNRDFFIGMGAGIVVTIFVILLLVFYYVFSWWLPGGNILSRKTESVRGKTLESRLEAPSYPSTTLAAWL
jgi:hypothetical protein